MIPCPAKLADCVDRFENTPFGLRQIVGSHALLLLMVILVANTPIYSALGGSITKSMTAFSRITIDAIKIVIVAVISVLAGWERLNVLEVWVYKGAGFHNINYWFLHFQ